MQKTKEKNEFVTWIYTDFKQFWSSKDQLHHISNCVNLPYYNFRISTVYNNNYYSFINKNYLTLIVKEKY